MRDDQEEQQGDRPRPKVVDKRISARAPAPGPAPAAPVEPPPTAEATVGSVPESASEAAPPQGPPGERVWTPEQEAEARRMAEEIAATPSLEWVVNVAATLANVAGTKLDLGAAADAQLAIDALAGVLSSVGTRLGGAERPLRQLLADLQLAYAQRATAPPQP